MTNVVAPDGRSLSHFGEPSPAEVRLLEACRSVNPLELGQERPSSPTADNSIRPAFLRFLMLGGDKDAVLHEKGVMLFGAYLDGDLDLENSSLRHPAVIEQCHINGKVNLRWARIFSHIHLNHTSVEQIEGYRLRASNGLSFEGIISRGRIMLADAEIDGILSFSHGSIKCDDDHKIALYCDRIRVTGSVFLRNEFEAFGEIRFTNALIGGDLDLSGGKFLHTDTPAITLDGATIKGCLWLGASEEHSTWAKKYGRTPKRPEIEGDLSLYNVSATTLVSDMNAWPKNRGRIRLDGFTYQKFGDGSALDFHSLQEWLNRQPAEDLGGRFKTQPFEQCTKVLNEMGLSEEARQIALLKQRQLTHAKMARSTAFGKPIIWLWRNFLDLSIGYGYKPHRTVIAATFVWVAAALIYEQASRQDIFAPADAQVYLSDSLKECKSKWNHCSIRAFEEHPAFQPFTYSADLLLPVGSLGQSSRWVPMLRPYILLGLPLPEWFVRGIVWAEILFGWAAGFILVAVLSGVVKTET
jgi:hypothetical protein